jgi:hypothetical protein
MSSCSLIATCFMSFALCHVLINCFTFLIIRCISVFLLRMFCCPLCAFCVFVLYCVFFLPTYVTVYFASVYKYTDHCHRVETQLQLINIISYPTHHLDTPGIRFPTISFSYRIAKILEILCKQAQKTNKNKDNPFVIFQHPIYERNVFRY